MAKIDRKKAKAYLSDVVDVKKQFVLSSGARLANIYDLDEYLPIMHPEVFSHHVNSARNDFAAWIENVIGDQELAHSIELVRDRDDMHKIVAERIKILEKSIREPEVRNDRDQMKKDKAEIDDIKEGKAQSNIHKSKFLKKVRDHKIRKSRPKRHEYTRCHHEHIHHGVWEFLYGLVCGIFLTLIALRIFGFLY